MGGTLKVQSCSAAYARLSDETALNLNFIECKAKRAHLVNVAQVGVKTRNRGIYDDPDRQFGRESRSLKGCYELFLAGFNDVTHLQGGLSGWRHSKRGLEGSRADRGNMFA